MIELNMEELKQLFIEYNDKIDKNKESGHELSVSAYIVYKSGNWEKPYSISSRTYKISSNAKMFHTWMGGYSLFGSALDGNDNGVRLENIGWNIDYCYLDDEDYKKVVDYNVQD